MPAIQTSGRTAPAPGYDPTLYDENGNYIGPPATSPGPPPQPAYSPESSAYTAAPATSPGPPPQPDYVATDPGYDLVYPGPPPQPEYIPTTQSAPADPLPQSPSMAGPPAPPQPESPYGTSAPTGNNVVTSTYPATGTTTVQTKDGAVQPYYPIQVAQTYRTIPPAGSTYPETEIAYGIPPRNQSRINQQYAQGNYPDLEPRFPGDGPLGQGPPQGPNSRQVPAEVWNSLRRPWFRGEGNMGARDPLSDYNTEAGERPIVGAGHYTFGMGETRPEDIWRPGTGTPYDEATMARARAKPENAGHVPPEGYVPEIWGGRGDYMSSYWLEKAPAPEEIQPHGAGYTGDMTLDQYDQWDPPTTSPLPSSYTRRDTLVAMDRRRQERRLRGLFGGGR